MKEPFITIIGFLALTLSVSQMLSANPVNTPPSCVITYPHMNAYYEAGSDMIIRVYATDIGGTFPNGTVGNVAFYVDDQMVHETSSHTSNTYSFVWENLERGTYRITATATDSDGISFTSAGVLVSVGEEPVIKRGLSAGKGKYLGNIVGYSGIRNDFNTYWNSVTAENGGKWGVVEGTRGSFNWTHADAAYNHARYNHMAYRYHALAWGSQYPGWITDLEPAEFEDALENYMIAVAERYPMIDQVDVLNEQLRTHAAGTGYFRDGLGGTGETGYDWQIKIFEMARKQFPNAKLVLNDYGLENDGTAINEMLGLVAVLRDRGLIDGFGTQAHHFNVDQMASSPATLKNRIDLMASGGVPVYATELDLRGIPISEANQLTSYQRTFPVFWEHPAVAGITLWGYVEGLTWREGTELINSDGTKRAAMVWLEEYLAQQADIGYPFYGIDAEVDLNMIFNGEFNQGLTGWSIQNNSGAFGAMEVVTDAEMSGTNALRICPQNQGSSNWHIQVRQLTPLENSRSYSISFMAKADADRPLDVAIQQDAGSYTTHFQQRANLTPEVQSFHYEFTSNVDDPVATLKFYVGNHPECVTIDNVQMVDLTDPATSISETELITDGIRAYPNPFTDQLRVDFCGEFEGAGYRILNINGQLVSQGEITENRVLCVNDLPAGIYFLQVNGHNMTETIKVIKL